MESLPAKETTSEDQADVKRRKPRGLSPSSAGVYNQCPKRWEFRYIDGLIDPPTEPAVVGTFAHLVLEHLMQLDPSERNQDKAKVLARELWDEFEQVDDFRDLDLDAEQARAFRWKAWAAIEGLWALEDPSATQVKETEQRVSVELDGVPFRGIVDRVDITAEGLVVTDYKSGKAPSQRFEGQKLKQVLLYAAAIEAMTGKAPVGARLHYLGQRSVSTWVTEAGLIDVVAHLRQTWADVLADYRSGRFKTKTGPLCAWCPYVNRCQVGVEKVLELRSTGRVRDDAPALATLKELGHIS